ncbi:MAG: DNA polymerase III subunit epsilon [Rhodobacteraceae bacterium]|nr:DNA polymerase III subunit epsilon [Paracoccaceae bacterium]
MATEIVVDTETTGLVPKEGHRIVEIGMVEIEGFTRTGRVFHRYLNPERTMPREALEIHGLTDEFLEDKPLFGEVADEFLEFIGQSRLVIHNADFDLGFINHELAGVSRSRIPPDQVLDTLQLARKELPAIGFHNLDALCRHYRIDRSMRTKHGALLDAELLTEVYFRLNGGGQGLFDLLGPEERSTSAPSVVQVKQKPRKNKLKPLLTSEETVAHSEFVRSLGDSALWNSVAAPKAASDPVPESRKLPAAD